MAVRLPPALLAAAFVGCSSTLAGQGVPSLAQPGISPDGTEIAFVSGDDLWTVPAAGGEARLLVAHSATEERPLYSPDGTRLAFGSNREGSMDVWVLDLSAGALTRLTHHDGNETVEGWSPDGEWVYFVSSRQDVQGNTDVFRVRAEGGTPMPVLADRYESEFWASPGPDDRILISTRGRMARSQWWRNGHAHIDEAEIWVATAPAGADPAYTRVSAGGKNVWPLWSEDGRTAYWVSDRDGTENLWRGAVDGEGDPERLTDFTDGRTLWPTISRRGDVVAFERDFGLWTWSNGEARPVEVRLRGAVESPRLEFRSLTTFDELALSPDGDKVAVVARGEVFVAAADSGGPALRVTRTRAPESDVAWGPDSDALAYVATRDEWAHVYVYDFASGEERALTDADANDVGPTFSPDGERLALLRDGRQLVVVDVDSGAERVVAEGVLAFAGIFAGRGNFAWSPDGEWLAFLSWPTGEFGNVHVVPVAGGEARPVSFLANAFAGNVTWSPDGSFVLFGSNQRTEDTNLFRVDLVPQTPAFREDRVRRLFEAEPAGRSGSSEAAAGTEALDSATVRIEFDGLRRRASIVPTSMSVGGLALSPDGKTAVFTGSAAGRQNIYAVSLDPLATGPDTPRPLTSTDGGKGALQFTPDGRSVLFLHQGRIRKVPVTGGNESGIAVAAEIEVDFDAEKVDVFLEGWRTMRDGFYDPAWHGADWNAVRSALEPRIRGARTVGEMRRLMNLMVGELNGSHLGVGGPTGISTAPTGALGVSFDRTAYESRGILIVSEVVPLGPADVAGIEPGMVLVGVGDETVVPGTNLHALLLETVGERLEIRVADVPGGEPRTVVLKPMSSGAEAQLRYRDWVEGRRAYVDSVSGGRLGYVHMADMSAGALAQLYLDLDQDNHDRDGVVIDLRNNNGGFVNAYALDVFTRRNYFTMRPRGGLPAPSRLQLGQRALLAPTVLVTNQHTLSDGEDFTEGYRTLGLGPVVGEPTAGWIIYTSNISLFDGTSFRVPFIEVRGAAGDDMELHPRAVDVEVERPAGESYTGRDAQLDRAIEELLARLGG